ncbi:MAG: ribonuclease R [Lachnospiraceae bacterium]|nr:ribonuclease R [Lachnospiraceae bacterium]
MGDDIKRSDRKNRICELVESSLYVPMKEKELAALMQVDRQDREEFAACLQELLLEGKLMLTPRGKYVRGDGSVLTGTFIGNAKGFGFVEIEGRQEDLFVPAEQTGGAFHKDIVQVLLQTPGGAGRRQEAKVIRVIQRGILSLVGTYEKGRGHYGFVIPDNTRIPCDIFVPEEASKGAVTGHKVVVEITDYGTGQNSQSGRHGGIQNPSGKITEIIGHINDPGVDIMSIVRGYELPVEFPEKVMQQVERVAKPVSEADMAGRRDLRDVQMVTIDGEDAKDLDDAVHVTCDGENYHLGVHIADVTNYVQENSALDREALKRGTSVYLVDRVIPMLPHALSNGICSLNAGEDRLALSCLMTINPKGEIVDYEICESVIRVDRRMSYNVVKAILEEPADGAENRKMLLQEYEALLSMFRQMRELAAILREKRRKRGAIDFDFPECKILLDRSGHPTEIKPYERNAATDLIEEFMLAANETVAQHFYWMEVPFVYRVHDVPDPDKIQKLALFIHNFGYFMKSTDKRGSKVGSMEVHPKEIQKLLERIEGTPEEPMIARLTLRSMKQAKYSVVSSGHFGLASKYYCHFTSPIRRYPDLQIHRIIKEQLRGKMTEERIAHYRDILPGVAEATSKLERRADEAERETDKLKKVEFMEQHIDEEFDGVISGVTAWGIYVELPNTVEGLVHVSRLEGDYYYFNESACEMVGSATGRSYKLGMPMRVRVVECDRFTRTIDFEPA